VLMPGTIERPTKHLTILMHKDNQKQGPEA